MKGICGFLINGTRLWKCITEKLILFILSIHYHLFIKSDTKFSNYLFIGKILNS